MVEAIVKAFFDYLSSDESPILKIAKLLGLLIAVLAVVFVLESAMGLITIGRLERKVNLLRELSELADSGLGKQENLEILFDETLTDLVRYNPNLSHMGLYFFQEDFQPALIEVGAGSIIWVILGIVALNTTKGGCIAKVLVSTILIAFGICVGLLTDFITSGNSGVMTVALNCILGILPLAMLLLVIASSQRRRSQAPTPESANDPDG